MEHRDDRKMAEDKMYRLEWQLEAKRQSARIWLRKLREVVGNEFADRPAPV
jgi:hypothetical protein